MRTTPVLYLSLALVGVLLLTPRTPRAEVDAEARFRDANAAFAAGQYEVSAAGFQSLIDNGLVSTPLLYDLANAEARAGRTGRAVLYYERALSLSPRDPDVLANLRHVRGAANLEEPQQSIWAQTAAWLTVDEWAGLAIAGLWTTCALVAVFALRSRADARPPRLVVLGTIGSLALSFLGASLAVTRSVELQRGIVLGAKPELKVAPFEAATGSVDLRPGSIVGLERSHGDFILARTVDGQAGWIFREQVERIVPP